MSWSKIESIYLMRLIGFCVRCPCVTFSITKRNMVSKNPQEATAFISVNFFSLIFAIGAKQTAYDHSISFSNNFDYKLPLEEQVPAPSRMARDPGNFAMN